MSLSLLVTIFNQDLTISGTYPALGYSLMFDALSNQTSTVMLKSAPNIKEGDYIALRANNSDYVMYYGQIITMDTDSTSGTMTLSSNFIWNVLNGDILVTNRTGTSYEAHLKSLMTKYSSAVTNVFRDITVSTNTPYEVTSSNGTVNKNFIDYIIRGFKLHNVVIAATKIGQGTLTNGEPFFYPKIEIKQESDTMNFSDKIVSLRNWKVTDSRLLRGYANELWLVDKATADMENPTIMGKYWLQTDGLVVNRINDLVNQPTQLAIYLYDKTATDNPDNDSIGRANLGGNSYSHNIQFSVNINNNFVAFADLKLGLQSNIFYQDRIYKSILTGYELSSDSDDINLTFGNLRFGKKDLVDSDI